ncbi:MAG TPA: hypothetical protein VI322_01400 [Candidatus Saccharimonadia bacterium]
MSLLGWLSFWVITAVAGLAVLVLSFVFTSPQGLGPVGVTIWFVLLYVTLSAVFTLAIFAAKHYLRLHAAAMTRLRYSQRQGMLVAGLVVGCLSLSSLKQLSWLDAILLGLILVIVEVYVRFRWP